MTTCEWCGRAFTPTNRRGPRPKYCKQSCRQRAYEDRRPGVDITEEDVEAWMDRQRTSLIGRFYDMKQPTDREAFVKWFMSIVEDIDAHNQDE